MPSHVHIGLTLLSQLVTEMHHMLTIHSLSQHRKLATGFRDKQLMAVFKLALNVHRELLSGPQGMSIFVLDVD